MKFYNIRNARRFMEVIRGCEGPVYAISGEGRRIDMKRFAEQAAGLGFTLGATGDEGIELFAERNEDSLRLFRFMSEAAKVGRADGHTAAPFGRRTSGPIYQRD